MSPSDDGTSLLDLLNGVGEREIGELKAQLQRRVDELTEDELRRLVSARQDLAQRASDLLGSIANARLFFRSVDERLGNLEAAAQAAKQGSAARSALEAFEVVFRVAASLTDMERAVLQTATQSDGIAPETLESRPQTDATVVLAQSDRPVERVGAETENDAAVVSSQAEAELPRINVFDSALDRLRRARELQRSS